MFNSKGGVVLGAEKFFIKDSAINCKQDDAFSYIDYVSNLKKIVECNEAPFNIAIIGKWGVGKSSIVNLLKEELNGKEEYKIEEINAWKYENTSIKKAFIKQIYKSLNGNKDDLAQYLKEFLNSSIKVEEHEKEKKEGILKIIKSNIDRTGAFLVFFIIVSIVIYAVIMGFDLLSSWISNGGKSFSVVWQNYINPKSSINVYETLKSFKDKMFVPLALIGIGEIAKLISAYKAKKVLKYEINPAIESTDEYEDKFKETLKNYKKENKKFKKLIVVIDDLDRLSPKKIVDALDAIKAFIEAKECIFIVPFDDSILRKAINSKKLNDFSSVDGEAYLDKLFQFKLILPPLIDMDMKEYAYNLCDKEIPEIFNLCPSFKTILEEILIHPYVSTPRQIIKIINTFVSNILIVKNRENKKLEVNLITEKNGLNMLAKISVLQADFPEFYECLLQDNNLILKLMESYYSQKGDDNSIDIKSFGINNMDTLNALIGFLTKTEYIYADNLAPFIYLGQDSLGLSAGDKKQRSIRKDLLSGNEMAVIKYSQNNLLSIIDTRIIIQGIKESKTTDLQQVLKFSMQIITYVPEELIEEFANEISNKINIIIEHGIEFRYWQVDFQNYLTVYMKASNKNGIEKALDTVIKLVFGHGQYWKQKNGAECDEVLFNKIIGELVEECLYNESVLSESIKQSLREFINNGEYPVENVISIYNNHKNLIKDYFSDNFYNRLCVHIGKEDINDEINALEALEEIAVTVREENIERFSAPLRNVICNESNALKVCNLLLPVAGDISIKNSIGLVNEFISFDYNKNELKKIIEVVLALNWDLDKIENERLNEFIIKIFDQNYFDEICDFLCVKISASEYKMINRTIEHISEKCLSDRSFYNLSIYMAILKNITLQQTKYIINKIEGIVGNISDSVNVDDFKTCVSIIKILLENEQSHKLLSDLVDSKIIYYGSPHNYANVYPKWADAFTEIIGATKDVINKSKLEEYVGLLINYVVSYSPDIMIKGLYYLGEKTPESYAKETIGSVISYANSYDTKTIGISYLKSMEKYINKNNSNLLSYETFLINCIDVDTNTVLQNLSSFFTEISKDNLCKVIMYLMNTNTYNRDFALSVLCGFFNKVNKSECIRDILLFPNDDNSFDFIRCMLDYNNELIYKEILDRLITDITDQDTILYLFNLLIFASYYKDNIDRKLIANLVNHIWINFGDSDIIKLSKILTNHFSGFKFQNAKSTLNENIVEIFKKSNIEAKRSILHIAKMFDFNRTFKDSLKVMEFSDDEKALLKEILRFS